MKQKVAAYIDRLVANQFLTNKKIIVFGANASGSIIINDLLARDIYVDKVLDNNQLLDGSYFLEIEVRKPEKELIPFYEKTVILIASRYYEEMKRQLEALGYSENIHIFEVVDLNRNSDFNLSDETFNKYMYLVEQGIEVYERLKYEFHTDLIMMSPVKPNGDIYIICSYLNQYIKEKYNGANYVFTVVGKSCELTAGMFDVANIKLISVEENDALVALANFYPEKIRVLNPYHNYQEIYHYLDGYRGLTFVEEIKHGLLGLSKEIQPELPNVSISEERLVQICEQYGVVKGKSVIIAPYANSIPLIKANFWEELVASLKMLGLKVFTNCGTPEEDPIQGSERIFYEFHEAVAVSEFAGTIICYRSGFSEIIATSKCRKIIIYPNHMKGFSTLRVLFGMEDALYEQENLYQITNTYTYLEELLQEVLKCVEEVSDY
ncbi:hypothetical protein [Metasolibacillus meyeri]|uniref:hypothetical protein n=1 Tax=Metasolibacillus meyeri TaxID=1071052 RepID=UPI000D300067|nr:hypothetical protein [Metasolibacillus meyeri]